MLQTHNIGWGRRRKFSGKPSVCVTCRHVENYAYIFVTWKQRRKKFAR